MSYQIIYGPQKRPLKSTRKNLKRSSMIAGILLIVFLVTLRVTGYGSVIWQSILPGDPEITANAFQNMTDALKCGNGLPQAITTFCETVIEGAKIAQ